LKHPEKGAVKNENLDFDLDANGGRSDGSDRQHCGPRECSGCPAEFDHKPGTGEEAPEGQEAGEARDQHNQSGAEAGAAGDLQGSGEEVSV
jgi:hypothetical protein